MENFGDLGGFWGCFCQILDGNDRFLGWEMMENCLDGGMVVQFLAIWKNDGVSSSMGQYHPMKWKLKHV